ncbi:uncharacterized protein K460DRAFT_407283 [Cucurbitaria berberidis CBS 394.84]|uniref:Uncharacterized protein n=1 Tax=Cucurbitaria berberidis CBS 394.84 TaxID=1168544 RepID=A0A9P4GCU9_9PLEO|nr:uncharacterized protein K460DRAFT_407283 [Cucurbitaria berberidis CBS 394.84]KAF1842904.1 hypothetical protein K460DRAFT_407283 [Cucurbitaria berberidis CBS 394.84]
MLFNRTVPRCSNTPPPNCSTTSPSTPRPSKPSSAPNSDDTAPWDLLTTPSTPPKSDRTTQTLFDTATFPAESYLLPSDRNGTWRTEAIHALQRPSETAVSIHRHASELNWPTCRNKVQDLADAASDGLNSRLNQALEGHDVVELGNRVVELIPSVSMPSIRRLGQTIDSVSDIARSLVERRKSETDFLDQELQGDQWAFARIMSTKARKALVKQRICQESQVTPNQITSPWQDHLNSALAATFTREKESFSTTSLFSMTPVWSADAVNKTWRLELDTGLTSIEVDSATDGYTEQPVRVAVSFELPESCGSLILAEVERAVVDSESEWMMVMG